MSPVLQILVTARGRVASGWCQHEYESESGAVCALGALGFDEDMSNDPAGEAYEARSILRELCGWELIPTWNDMPGRTQGEVVELFDRAIALLTTKTS